MDADVLADNYKEELNENILSVKKLAIGTETLHGIAQYFCTKFQRRISESNNSSLTKSATPFLTNVILEYVKKRDRMINKNLKRYFDEHPPFQIERYFISGSFADGLFIYGRFVSDTSDVDYMCVLQNIWFSEEDQKSGDLAIRDDTPFVKAYLSDIELLKTWHEFVEEPASEALQGSICQLSARKLKERLLKNYATVRALYPRSEEYRMDEDSPSLEVTQIHDDHSLTWGILNFWRHLDDSIRLALIPSHDIVLSIRCDGWPQIASEWIHRRRLHWPSHDAVKEISIGGFHIVGKSSLEGNFRLSFSKAEVVLVQDMNKLQYKVFRAFKAVYKFLILPEIPSAKKIISSYHLKTIVFWHVENSQENSWSKNDGHAVVHLLSLLDELAQALQNQFLPMYFLPKFNLLKNVENVEELETVAKRLAKLSKNIPDIIDAVKNNSCVRSSYVM